MYHKTLFFYKKIVFSVFLLFFSGNIFAQTEELIISLEKSAKNIEEKIIEWRHTIHQNPELSNREFNTAKMIAKHLKSLGLEVQTNIAHTGVVGVLKTGEPGHVVALRADMDALPVTERVEIPFKSVVESTYNGQKTGVMHACGHDTHVSILMGVAEVLAKHKSQLKGTFKFIFQPAEEGAPKGEEGGAALMIKEGVLKKPDVDVVFGLHISSGTQVGEINYRGKGIMAAADRFTIEVHGKQSHGSRPWGGVDPIVISAQIVNALQTVVSRSSELTKEAVVVTVGMMQSGIRNNIIPEYAKMIGTIRTLDTGMQRIVHSRIQTIATKIGESMGAKVDVSIEIGVPVTYNDPKLTKKVVPWLEKAVGKENINLIDAITGAEDFSFYAKEVPGFFFFIGGCPDGTEPKDAFPHHTPDFYVDDSGMLTGVKALLNLAVRYVSDPLKKKK